jgi:hypothetical protein
MNPQRIERMKRSMKAAFRQGKNEGEELMRRLPAGQMLVHRPDLQGGFAIATFRGDVVAAGSVRDLIATLSK